MDPRFSDRTAWDLRPNPLSEALEARRRSGAAILDLTASNPTRCGFPAPGREILAALASEGALAYEPDPRGLPAARQAVSGYYEGKGAAVPSGSLLLTSSTSEAYAYLFRLLANPGDAVLAPAPSYPLFDYLARANDVRLRSYPLREEDGFRIDLAALEAAAGGARALLVVNPGNPTGAYLRRDERERLVEICGAHGLALVVDEVFSDFALAPADDAVFTLAGEDRVLTFVLNGFSKMLALPQMKLGWVAASGPARPLAEAAARLEVIADTYLSVGTPVQAAAPALLGLRERIQAPILARLEANLAALRTRLAPPSRASALAVEGGWSAVIRVPSTRTDEAWAVALLDSDGVLVHPGFFYDFPSEGRLVVSLLPEEPVFREAIERLAARIAA